MRTIVGNNLLRQDNLVRIAVTFQLTHIWLTTHCVVTKVTTHGLGCVVIEVLTRWQHSCVHYVVVPPVTKDDATGIGMPSRNVRRTVVLHLYWLFHHFQVKHVGSIRYLPYDLIYLRHRHVYKKRVISFNKMAMPGKWQSLQTIYKRYYYIHPRINICTLFIDSEIALHP